MSSTASRAQRKYDAAMRILSRKISLSNRHKGALRSFEEAAELFQQANLSEKLGNAKRMVALCQEELGIPAKAALSLKAAGDAFFSAHRSSVAHQLGEFSRMLAEDSRPGNPREEAFACFAKSAQLFAQAGKPFQSGRVVKVICEFVASEIEDLKRALEVNQDRMEAQEPGEEGGVTDELLQMIRDKIREKVVLCQEHFDKQIDYMEMGLAYAHVNRALEDVGDICAEHGEYERAVHYYEKLLDAEWNQEHTNMGKKSPIQFTADKVITKTLLNRIACIDPEAVEESLMDVKINLDDLSTRTRTFRGDPDYKLIHGICAAIENEDLTAFQRVCRRYNRVNQVPDQIMNVLVAIRRIISEILMEEETNA